MVLSCSGMRCDSLQLYHLCVSYRICSLEDNSIRDAGARDLANSLKTLTALEYSAVCVFRISPLLQSLPRCPHARASTGVC